jgi:hypothetical protein
VISSGYVHWLRGSCHYALERLNAIECNFGSSPEVGYNRATSSTATDTPFVQPCESKQQVLYVSMCVVFVELHSASAGEQGTCSQTKLCHNRDNPHWRITGAGLILMANDPKFKFQEFTIQWYFRRRYRSSVARHKLFPRMNESQLLVGSEMSSIIRFDVFGQAEKCEFEPPFDVGTIVDVLSYRTQADNQTAVSAADVGQLFLSDILQRSGPIPDDWHGRLEYRDNEGRYLASCVRERYSFYVMN